MAERKEKKLNWLERNLPEGLVVDAALADQTRLLHVPAQPVCERRMVGATDAGRLSPRAWLTLMAAGCDLACIPPGCELQL
jgi:hypothetical protein